MKHYRLTIDTGGTFSDLVLFEEGTRTLRVLKVPSTPDEPSRAVLDGLDLLADDGVDPRDIDFFFHGTTVATNTLLEGRGATVGLVITEGFRGVYEAMEQSRPYGRALFDLTYTKPALLAPESRTAEVKERIAPDGQVIRSLDPSCIDAAINLFETEDVEAIGICLLFSFMNPAHEQEVRDALRSAHPEWWISASSDLAPRIREYQRLSTTVVNAYVSPALGRYTQELEQQLDSRGVAIGRRFTMQSNGGSTPLGDTSERAAGTLLSGPAGGVMAGIALAAVAGIDNLITFDMGGTSCDVALVEGGAATTVSRGMVAGREVALPMLDIHTVSAGGGTLARVDPQGALHLGPDSAGSVPGPVCYGRGGTAPTVTDADVVLGYLSPRALLAGSLPINRRAADRALRENIADPLSVDLLRAADGVVKVAEVMMSEAIKAISTYRGLDVREFTLVAYGGAGPVHASRIAVELGIRTVLVPPRPGVFSALGLMLSDVKHDHVRSRLERLDQVTEAIVTSLFADMCETAALDLRRAGFAADDVRLQCLLELRYAGQGYELAVPIDRMPLEQGDLMLYSGRFHEMHRRRHGHAAPDQPLEVVNYRVEAIGLVPKVSLPPLEPAIDSADTAITGKRPALFSSLWPAPKPTPVYDRTRLRAGHRFDGPAIVEQYDATTIVCPEQAVVVDAQGNLVVSLRSET